MRNTFKTLICIFALTGCAPAPWSGEYHGVLEITATPCEGGPSQTNYVERSFTITDQDTLVVAPGCDVPMDVQSDSTALVLSQVCASEGSYNAVRSGRITRDGNTIEADVSLYVEWSGSCSYVSYFFTGER